ncbi:MAG: hypothetical protein JNN30_21280 [Rhodanobacteraceae bacterium]|nr:hypothetical protein [Rhodanobacteraceae bacterium]
MSTKFARAALAAALGIALVGCGKDEPPAAPPPAVAAKAAATPEGAIMAPIAHLKSGNIDGLMQSVLPPDEYAKAKADYAKEMNKEPASEEDKAKFAENMAKLTAADAEAKLWSELEPQLKELDAQMAQQMPMMVAMGKGFIQSSIQQNQELTEAQKLQATQAVDAIGNWVTTAKFTDPALAQKSIKIVCDTARKINLKTLDEARALSYEQAMGKAGIAYLGVKDVLNVYGFSIDQTLDSIKAETVSSDANSAKVKISYSLLNTPLSAESDLVKVGERWYGKEMMESLKTKDAAVSEPAAAPAPTTN